MESNDNNHHVEVGSNDTKKIQKLIITLNMGINYNNDIIKDARIQKVIILALMMIIITQQSMCHVNHVYQNETANLISNRHRFFQIRFYQINKQKKMRLIEILCDEKSVASISLDMKRAKV